MVGVCGLKRIDPVDRRLASWIALAFRGLGIATVGSDFGGEMAGSIGRVGFVGEGGSGTGAGMAVEAGFFLRSSSSASSSLINTSKLAMERSGAVEVFIAGIVATGRILGVILSR
jgi:hypothetical protein